MRILHVTSSLLGALGGAEQYCLRVAAAQAARGDQVTILTGWIDDAARKRVRSLGLDLVVAGPWRPYPPNQHGDGLAAKVAFHGLDALSRAAVDRLVGAGNFDVAHVHRFQGFGLGVLRSRSIPIVHTVHDYALVDTSATTVRGSTAPDRLSLGQRIRVKLANRAVRAAQLIFPSRRTMERHLQLGLSPLPKHQHVIPHGWSLPEQAAPVARTGEVRFTFLGKLEEHKGIDALLTAWGDGVPGATLAIAGAGEREPDVRAAAERGVLEFVGWADDRTRSELLARTDVVLMTSLWPENFPLVIAEGVLAGCAVLFSSISRPPLADPGVNAVDYDGVNQLRERMEWLASRPAEVDELRAGSVSLRGGLGIVSHLDAVDEVYRLAQAGG